MTMLCSILVMALGDDYLLQFSVDDLHLLVIDISLLILHVQNICGARKLHLIKIKEKPKSIKMF